MKPLWLFFIGLHLVCWGKTSGTWDEARLLYEDTHKLFYRSLYTDKLTGTLHITFDSGDGYGYLRVFQNGSVSNRTSFALPGPGDLFEDGIFITGADNGRNLYLLLARDSGKPTQGLYFTESTDDGTTWTSPLPLKTGPGTVNSRSIVYVKETGRVFVFYSRDKCVSFVTRAPGSLIFGSEKDVYCSSVGVLPASVDCRYIMLPRDGISLIVTWRGLDGPQYNQNVSHSQDYGLTWSEPTCFGATESKDNYASGVVVDPKLQRVFVAYEYLYAHYRMRYSDDYGQTWTMPFLTTSFKYNPLGWPNVRAGYTVCEYHGKLIMYVLYNVLPMFAECGAFDPYAMVLQPLPEPFPHFYYRGGVGLSCSSNATHTVVKAIGQDGNDLYLTTAVFT